MNICEFQEVCERYDAGHKRKVHHIRLTERCVKYIDGGCADLQGQSCFISKGKLARELRESNLSGM